MRGVASLAALALDGFVLEDERPTLVAMALEANHILVRRRPKLTVSRSSVRIVAIIALDQPLYYAVMERLLEVSSLFDMAGEAQRRLLLYQQVF
jgi:hypothetical protein